jgi:hypothetical protein
MLEPPTFITFQNHTNTPSRTPNPISRSLNLVRLKNRINSNKMLIYKRKKAPCGLSWMPLDANMVVDATLLSAPSLTKNSSAERDPEMHQTKKGDQWNFAP